MPRDDLRQIAGYRPVNGQETADRHTMLRCCELFGDTVLSRANSVAHITSSGFLMNPSLTGALLVHHNIMDRWAWTGGHVDGETDLLGVAVREAREETGAKAIQPLSRSIAAVDILPVPSHTRRGEYVGAHLHLSVAFVLICAQDQPLRSKPDENSGVRWFSVDEIAVPRFSPQDACLYGKLIRFARAQAARPRHTASQIRRALSIDTFDA